MVQGGDWPKDAGAFPSAASGHGHRLFETALGRCGIAWSPNGIQALQLPEATDPATQARLLSSAPAPCARGDAPVPRLAQVAIDGVTALLSGQPRDLGDVVLDMSRLSVFQQRVYEITRRVPPGVTVEYADIAHRLGAPGAARAVGRALGLNPFAPVVPCHRVLARGGRAGGFSAEGGAATKLRMLSIEGAMGPEGLPLFRGPDPA